MKGSSFLRKFFPDERVTTVEDVDYQKLIDSGIKAVIFDLDNTIARWGDDSLAEEIIELFERLTSLGLKVGILSNSRRETIEDFIKDLPFPHLFNANKPSLKGFKSILAELDVSPEETAMIGDQLFTDVLGANRLDMYTVRVEPIDPDREYRFTKLNRVGEKVILFLREVYRSLRQLKETVC
ncbi:MAG: YqeG family HAD IIIA-type phosphatase [Candidatus Bipolaricaulota bacterium]|nr:YqeG family HAD IIIA-type phosphatase [Candidatus Bipolaricaulota bacterium]MBS3791922.1 YqeG family HAD IIIA-type phosphatase [Candidatus Bipolaricaulota bacterium]